MVTMMTIGLNITLKTRHSHKNSHINTQNILTFISQQYEQHQHTDNTNHYNNTVNNSRN